MEFTPLRDLPVLNFACDESSQTTDEFMVLGGIAYRSKYDHDIAKDLAGLKGKRFASTEVKWSKTKSGERLQLHKQVVDYFFSKLADNRFHFHSLVVPFSDFNHGLRAGGTKSTSVTRMLYQLCLHRPVRDYGKHSCIHIKPDHSDAYLGFKDYQDHLNADASKQFQISNSPVRDITFCHSEASPIHQINDLIIGGIAHRKNERHLEETASDHKCELADYINTKRRTAKGTFTLWHFLSPHLKAKSPT